MKLIKKILLIILSLAAVVLGLKLYYQGGNDPKKFWTELRNR